MKKVTILSILILCFSGSVNAQILKKLGKKIGKAAEKTIERKVEQKTKRETEKAFDSTFNKKSKRKGKKNNGKPKLSNTVSAESYAFKHKAIMHMKSGKEEINIDYFLPDADNFFGMAIKDEKIEGDFTMVYDIDRETMFSFVDNAGLKMKMGVSFKTNDDTSETPEFEIKATGNTKTILAYNCQEYKMTSKNMTATIWVTKDVDIRFPSTLYSNKNENNNQEWMKDLDGWAMEMKMIDTSRSKPHTITMNCISIETSNLVINSNDYKSFGK